MQITTAVNIGGTILLILMFGGALRLISSKMWALLMEALGIDGL